MNLLKELRILRYIAGHYLQIRKNRQYRDAINEYYKAIEQGNEIIINRFRGIHSHLFYQMSFMEHYPLCKFKDIHKGKSCFIIGNGPSLNKMNLTQLDGKFKFGLNKIYYLFDRMPLELDYYVSVDHIVVEQSKQHIEEGFGCPCFIGNEPFSKFLSPKNHIYSLKTRDAPWFFHDDLFKGCSEGNNVTFVAMQIAYYMGFQNVFLIGVDHNFFSSTGKPHSIEKMEGDDKFHFDSRYFKNQKWSLPNLEGSELSYRMAKYEFEKNGRKIFDATVGGKLNIFPKVSFEEALKHTQK